MKSGEEIGILDDDLSILFGFKKMSPCVTLVIKIIKRRGSRDNGNYFFKKFGDLRKRQFK